MSEVLSPADAPEAAPHPVTAVVPVKRLAQAKSRLALPPSARRALALAFAEDTLAALTGSPLVVDVLVVTADPEVAAVVRHLGLRRVPDEGSGLDPAVTRGLDATRVWRPDAAVAVVPADLPFLRPEDVTRVLADGSTGPGAFVPDRSRTGTTFVVCPPGSTVRPRYGPGSAARHAALGLRALDAPPGARHDVDTLADLDETAGLRPGRRTRDVLDALGLDDDPPRVSRRWPPIP